MGPNESTSLVEYMKSKRMALSHSLEDKKIIYLDTKYWITLKDQSLQLEDEKRHFFNLISTLSNAGKIVLPISEVTFYEVLKRTDKASLKQTIKIIDAFSKGIALVTRKEMMHLEFRSFFEQTSEKTKKLIWTKIPFIAYPTFLNHPGFKMGFNASINQGVIDRFWNLTFTDLFEMLDKNDLFKPFIFKDNVNYFNTQKVLHENENKTFEQMFLSELGGTLDLFDNIISEVMQEKYFEETGRIATEEELQDENKVLYRNLIYHAFRLKRINTELPSLKIFSSLFANNRWNKTKAHDENDTMDFLHATFALPYCDYFFTERSLGTTLKQNHLSFDKIYSCEIYHREDEILKMLSAI